MALVHNPYGNYAIQSVLDVKFYLIFYLIFLILELGVRRLYTYFGKICREILRTLDTKIFK